MNPKRLWQRIQKGQLQNVRFGDLIHVLYAFGWNSIVGKDLIASFGILLFGSDVTFLAGESRERSDSLEESHRLSVGGFDDLRSPLPSY